MVLLRLPTRVHGQVHARRISNTLRKLPSPLRLRRLHLRASAKAERSEVLGKVISIIESQLGTQKTLIKEETKFEELGADSLDVVEIMMAFEEQFGISLDEEGAEKIKTVAEAAELIQQEIEKST